MPRQRKSKTQAAYAKPIQRKHAAIDIGATSIYVAVPVDCDPQPVRSFQTFTEDLHRLADWLQHYRIKTVAMESTGVFWVPLFQILEQRGFEVCLVNARPHFRVPFSPHRKCQAYQPGTDSIAVCNYGGELQVSTRMPRPVAPRNPWLHAGEQT